MRWLSVVAMVVALAVAGVGCGGGDESASGDTTVTETTTEETTTEETTTEETTSGDTTTDLSGVLSDEDCLQLAGIGATFAQAITGSETDQEAAAAFQSLVDNVPDEIKADVQVLADWFAEYAAKVKDIGLEAGQTPTADQIQQLTAALAALDQEEVTAASQRLGVWSNENCSGVGG